MSFYTDFKTIYTQVINLLNQPLFDSNLQFYNQFKIFN
ncbi:hypothetical protein HNP24_002529 [Chryseobacterium sediminis]|uniref:Uncharacterized protein n=1 Tax=Chryseobacterium sediminis TaxID=1679494 RepID=A0ABR6Q4T1_9FLAO|nr:hypothetical protein [Chryseobacterium sediminis]